MRFRAAQSNDVSRFAPRIVWIFLTFAFSVAGPRAFAEDWPQFGRDGSRNAVSPEKGAPTWWRLEKRDRQGRMIREGKNIRWVADLTHERTFYKVAGDPVVAGGLVWVGCTQMTLEENPFDSNRASKFSAALVCLDERTGKELYRRVYDTLYYTEEAGRRHGHGSAPYIDGDTLWVLTNRCEVLCLDIGPLKQRSGPPRERWILDMRKELGVRPRAGHLAHRRSSVAIYKDWLYVITGNGAFWESQSVPRIVPAPDAPSLVCLEKATGKVVWTDNSPGKNILQTQSASPTVIEVGGRAQVVAPLGDGWVRAFDPATGKRLWEFDTNPPGASVSVPGAPNDNANYLPASAVFHGGRLYIANGQDAELGEGDGCLYCIDPTRSGDISPAFTRGPDIGKANPNSGLVWKFGGPRASALIPGPFGRTVANVTVADGLVMAADLGGTVYCLDANTGKLHWKQYTDDILSAPLVVDGRVYVATEDGLFIFALSSTKQVTGPVGGTSWTTCNPVFANGVLYLESGGYLYAIAGKDGPGDK